MDAEPKNHYIYLVQRRAEWGAADPSMHNVYKIGKTKQEKLQRFGGYDNGTILHIMILVEDCDVSETKLLVLFRTKYTIMSDHGTEYFAGDVDDMIDEIYKHRLRKDISIDEKKAHINISPPKVYPWLEKLKALTSIIDVSSNDDKVYIKNDDEILWKVYQAGKGYIINSVLDEYIFDDETVEERRAATTFKKNVKADFKARGITAKTKLLNSTDQMLRELIEYTSSKRYVEFLWDKCIEECKDKVDSTKFTYMKGRRVFKFEKSSINELHSISNNLQSSTITKIQESDNVIHDGFIHSYPNVTFNDDDESVNNITNIINNFIPKAIDRIAFIDFCMGVIDSDSLVIYVTGIDHESLCYIGTVVRQLAYSMQLCKKILYGSSINRIGLRNNPDHRQRSDNQTKCPHAWLCSSSCKDFMGAGIHKNCCTIVCRYDPSNTDDQVGYDIINLAKYIGYLPKLVCSNGGRDNGFDTAMDDYCENIGASAWVKWLTQLGQLKSTWLGTTSLEQLSKKQVTPLTFDSEMIGPPYPMRIQDYYTDSH